MLSIINIQGQMGNRPPQNAHKRRPTMSQAGSNYVTSALEIIFIIFFLQNNNNTSNI